MFPAIKENKDLILCCVFFTPWRGRDRQKRCRFCVAYFHSHLNASDFRRLSTAVLPSDDRQTNVLLRTSWLKSSSARHRRLNLFLKYLQTMVHSPRLDFSRRQFKHLEFLTDIQQTPPYDALVMLQVIRRFIIAETITGCDKLTCKARLRWCPDVSTPQTDLQNQDDQRRPIKSSAALPGVLYSSSLFFSSQTCSSLESSGTTRRVFQPWRFLDLRMSPKMWSPT